MQIVKECVQCQESFELEWNDWGLFSLAGCCTAAVCVGLFAV